MILSTLQGLPLSAVILRPSSINDYFTGNNNQQDSGMINLPSPSVSKNIEPPNDKTVAVSYTSKLIATVSTLICSNKDDYFEMEKEGKVFFVQRKGVNEVPYLLSLISDEPIPFHRWISECIGYWITILLGKSLANILRSAAEKSSLEINSSTFSSSVGNHSHGHDSYSSNGDDDEDDGDGSGWAYLRDEDREKFLIFEELFVRRILYNAVDISRSIVSHWLYPLSTLLSAVEYEFSGSLRNVCTATILSCCRSGGNGSSNSREMKHVCSIDFQPTLRSRDSPCCCDDWLELLQLFANTGGSYVFGLRIPVGYCTSNIKCDPNLTVGSTSQTSLAEQSVPLSVVRHLHVALQSAVSETIKRISVAFPGGKFSQLGCASSDTDNMKAIDDMFRDFPTSPSLQSSRSNLLTQSTAETVAVPSSTVSSETTTTMSAGNPVSDARVQLLPRPPPPKLDASSSSSSSSGARDSGLPTLRHRKLIATNATATSTAAAATTTTTTTTSSSIIENNKG